MRSDSRNERARLAAILARTPDALVVLDRRWRCTFVNRAAVRLLRRPARELLGRSIWEVFPRAAAFRRRYAQAWRGGRPAHFEEYYAPFRQWFEVHALPIGDELLLHFRDVTRRRQAEEEVRQLTAELDSRVTQRTRELQRLTRQLQREIHQHAATAVALQHTEERLQFLIANTPAVLYTCEPRPPYRVTFISANLHQQLGYTPRELLAAPQLWAAGIHPEDAPRVFAELARLLDHGAHRLEYRFRHKDGRYRWMLDEVSAVRDKRGTVKELIGHWVDITDRKHLEQRIIEVSEREQRRIGQDLHDSLGQHLRAVAFLTSSLKEQLAATAPAAAAEAARIGTLLDEASDQLRLLARGLHPVAADGYGLMAALHDLAGHVRRLFHVACRFDCPAPVVCDNHEVSTHLYRIAQEAINNAIVHGRPRRVTLRLRRHAGRIELTIHDDGRGLPRQPRPTSGLGLAIMKHRALNIGGVLSIHRTGRRGTRVRCSVPGQRCQPEAGR